MLKRPTQKNGYKRVATLPPKIIRKREKRLCTYLSSQICVALAREVGKLQQALGEAGRRDVVLALEGASHRHAEGQQQVRRLKVAAGEVRQQLHVAHLFKNFVIFCIWSYVSAHLWAQADETSESSSSRQLTKATRFKHQVKARTHVNGFVASAESGPSGAETKPLFADTCAAYVCCQTSPKRATSCDGLVYPRE